MFNLSRKIYNFFIDLYTHYSQVLKSSDTFDIGFLKRIKMKFYGFKPDHLILYDLNNNNPNEYINEVERWKTRRINGEYNLVLDNKLLCHDLFSNHVSIVENLIYIKNGKFYVDDNLVDFEGIIQVLREVESIFFKPVVGGGGKGVFKVFFKEDSYYLNDEKISPKQVYSLLRELDDYVGTRTSKQHNYSENICSKTPNTVRIVTIYDDAKDEILIPNAVHRFGTLSTIPVDNGSKGGIVANVDILTGVLSQGKDYYNSTYRIHPDSKKPIEGVQIPHWETIKNELRLVAKKFKYIPYLSWDIIVTEESFEVIEINASTGLTLFQLWGGD